MSSSFDNEHEAFADSRVSQYVYVPTKESVFTTLDQHADTLEGDIKLPLVLLGNEGSGKSALLSNWVAKRREHLHRDEFLYQHFVGCTTPSLQLFNTLHRLETELKNFFQLREMKVPDTEEELRWSLNRFLAAAAKKHHPARIVIIIDGIHRLRADGVPDGALHWLPAELPPCVRFIVSTVQFERMPRGKADIPQHRTYVELARRKCPMMKVEPLSVNTRHHVINVYISRNVGKFELTENQQFKIVTAPTSSQPMYLRSLLQAIRLCSLLTKSSTDQLLEIFLVCGTAHDLINKALDFVCQSIFKTKTTINNDDTVGAVTTIDDSDILGKMLSIIHASKNGLTEAEIWGIIRMISRYEPTPERAEQLLTIVKDFTMVVSSMHSFSHEIYREVVYDKYIRSNEALTRWHLLMAKYFGQLPPCDRKLVAQPYHLEVAGSWAKVKNCLTDIQMFQLWWTPKFKKDFIKFWASLARKTPKNSADSHSNTVTAKSNKNGTDGHHTGSNQRPSYDVVEEYVKSLDDYRISCHPSDETVANIILMVGDFLLEFATLGHEAEADVPAMVHPVIPSEDLANIGVPHITIDDEGRSLLIYPAMFQSSYSTDEGESKDAPTKAIDDIPICTCYFFSRWMWIQFPYIALGSCNARYEEGIKKFQESLQDNRYKVKKEGDEQSLESKGPVKKTIALRESGGSRGGDSFKLPEIKFHRKAARSMRKVNHDVVDDAQAAADKFTQRMIALQDDISNYREEHDFVIQMKAGLSKRLAELKGSLIELERSEESMCQFDGRFNEVYYQEKEAIKKYNGIKVLHKNLLNLSTMCDRHPAKMPALILEVEQKVAQDTFLVAEIKKRLWEQRFERNTHVSNFRKMKALVQDGVLMHNKLLEYRYSMKQKLSQQAADDEKKILMLTESGFDDSSYGMKDADSSGNNHGTLGTHGSRKKGNKLTEMKDDSSDGRSNTQTKNGDQSWDSIWQIISSRTGIIEPEIFFQRVNNRGSLEDQINTLKKTSEGRLESLRNEIIQTELELEEARYEASFAGGASSKDQVKEVYNKQQELRHTKERSENAQQLVKNLQSGFRHIAELLGQEISEEMDAFDASRECEAILDTLMEEREKQLQAQNQLNTDSTSRMLATRDANGNASPETHFRSPELEHAVYKCEQPQARLPSKLPSKPIESIKSPRESEEDDQDEDGMWDRSYVKLQAEKSFRMEKKRSERSKQSLGATN